MGTETFGTISSFLTTQEINQFIEITKKEKGISLTPVQAADQGERLIRSFELYLSQPIANGTISVDNQS